MLGIISCVSIEGIIGVNGFLPFKIKEDMRLFKETTSDHIVVMGRNTFVSMGSKPLPNRHNIVISRQDIPGVETHRSISSVLSRYAEEHVSDDKWIWFIGGSEIYREALTLPVNLISLTVVKKSVQLDCGDIPVYFPLISPSLYEVSQTYDLCKDVEVHLIDRLVRPAEGACAAGVGARSPGESGAS
jgi:dihydrofolate reductase